MQITFIQFHINLEPTGKGRFLNLIYEILQIPNLGTGDKPLFLKLWCGHYCQVYSIGLSLRSRRPVRPKGRTEHWDLILVIKNVFSPLLNYGTDRRGSVPPYSIARQFYPPHLYHASHFGLPYGRPRVGVVMVGRIGSLITWVWQED